MDLVIPSHLNSQQSHSPMLLTNFSFYGICRLQFMQHPSVRLLSKEQGQGLLHSIVYCAQASLHQMSVPIPGTGPYSVSYRLPVSVIFKTAPRETAETTIQSQNTQNFQVQNLTWRLERANCRAKSNAGNHNMNHKSCSVAPPLTFLISGRAIMSDVHLGCQSDQQASLLQEKKKKGAGLGISVLFNRMYHTYSPVRTETGLYVPTFVLVPRY